MPTKIWLQKATVPEIQTPTKAALHKVNKSLLKKKLKSSKYKIQIQI